jgi:L-ascorbate metabolism protein UlaG (beta-lactamase superfamily)
VNSDHSQDITLKWFGHSCFEAIINEMNLFFDPVRKNDLLRTILDSKGEDNPFAILISHEHWDHCDPKTILELGKKSTRIYGPESIENPILHEISFEVSDFKELRERGKKIVLVKEDESITFHDITIRCLKAQEGLSYLVSANNKKVLFMGDSIATKEMISKEPDVVLFPVWAVMGEEAKLDDFLELAQNKLCIPMHYHTSNEALPNFYVDLNEVKALLSGIDLKVIEKNRPYIL